MTEETKTVAEAAEAKTDAAGAKAVPDKKRKKKGFCWRAWRFCAVLVTRVLAVPAILGSAAALACAVSVLVGLAGLVVLAVGTGLAVLAAGFFGVALPALVLCVGVLVSVFLLIVPYGFFVEFTAAVKDSKKGKK